MSSQKEACGQGCQSTCFLCQIQAGTPYGPQGLRDSTHQDSIEVPVQMSGNIEDLKTDKLYDMIKRGEISIHNPVVAEVRNP